MIVKSGHGFHRKIDLRIRVANGFEIIVQDMDDDAVVRIGACYDPRAFTSSTWGVAHTEGDLAKLVIQKAIHFAEGHKARAHSTCNAHERDQAKEPGGEL